MGRNILVYAKGGKFCTSTLHLKEYKPSVVHNKGTEDEYVEVSSLDAALDMGYVLMSEEDYKALRDHAKCWQDGVLVDYEKTEEELERQRKDEMRKEIGKLKEKLKQTDYHAIKYAEGALSLTEFAPIREQRQTWRDEINLLEYELNH